MSPDLLNAEQYSRLGELYKRLDPNTPNQYLQPLSDEPENRESSDVSMTSHSDTPAKRGPGRPSKRPRTEHMGDSWYGLRHLNEIQLDISLRKVIEENPSYEAAYFFDHCSLNFCPPEVKGDPTIETLAKLCIPLRGPLPAPVMDNVRWLFEALAVGDLCMFLFGSRDRLTSSTKQSVREAAAELGTGDTAFIDDVLTIAYNVVFLCMCFGTGSLFWLRSNLSKDM